MIYLKNFIYSPGGENEGGPASTSPVEEQQKETIQVPDTTEEVKEDKPLGEKIAEALQEWSNKDQADQDFDDTQV